MDLPLSGERSVAAQRPGQPQPNHLPKASHGGNGSGSIRNHPASSLQGVGRDPDTSGQQPTANQQENVPAAREASGRALRAAGEGTGCQSSLPSVAHSRAREGGWVAGRGMELISGREGQIRVPGAVGGGLAVDGHGQSRCTTRSGNDAAACGNGQKHQTTMALDPFVVAATAASSPSKPMQVPASVSAACHPAAAVDASLVAPFQDDSAGQVPSPSDAALLANPTAVSAARAASLARTRALSEGSKHTDSATGASGLMVASGPWPLLSEHENALGTPFQPSFPPLPGLVGGETAFAWENGAAHRAVLKAADAGQQTGWSGTSHGQQRTQARQNDKGHRRAHRPRDLTVPSRARVSHEMHLHSPPAHRHKGREAPLHGVQQARPEGLAVRATQLDAKPTMQQQSPCNAADVDDDDNLAEADADWGGSAPLSLSLRSVHSDVTWDDDDGEADAMFCGLAGNRATEESTRRSLSPRAKATMEALRAAAPAVDCGELLEGDFELLGELSVAQREKKRSWRRRRSSCEGRGRGGARKRHPQDDEFDDDDDDDDDVNDDDVNDDDTFDDASRPKRPSGGNNVGLSGAVSPVTPVPTQEQRSVPASLTIVSPTTTATSTMTHTIQPTSTRAPTLARSPVSAASAAFRYGTKQQLILVQHQQAITTAEPPGGAVGWPLFRAAGLTMHEGGDGAAATRRRGGSSGAVPAHATIAVGLAQRHSANPRHREYHHQQQPSSPPRASVTLTSAASSLLLNRHTAPQPRPTMAPTTRQGSSQHR